MKISIIVPALNEEKTIKRLIKSIEKNTSLLRDEYEIIVVDGKSSDKTVAVAKKLADKVIIEKKRGIGLARNTGAKVSTGELLIFIDADVIIDSDVISHVYKHYLHKKMCCGTVYFKITQPDILLSKIFELQNTVFHLLSKLRTPRAFGAFLFISKKLFQKIRGFRTDIDGIEDTDLVNRADKYCHFEYLKKERVIFDCRRINKIGFMKWFIDALTLAIKFSFLKQKGTRYPSYSELK